MESSSPFKENVLKGKVALLTGGGSGIGFEISTQFGKHGASIAIMGRRKSVLDSAVATLRSLGIPVLIPFFLTLLLSFFSHFVGFSNLLILNSASLVRFLDFIRTIPSTRKSISLQEDKKERPFYVSVPLPFSKGLRLTCFAFFPFCQILRFSFT